MSAANQIAGQCMVRDLPTRDRVSLAAYLDHDSYDPLTGVFTHRDHSLAVGWVLGMVDTEVTTPEALERLAGRFNEFFKLVPQKSAVQFILTQDSRTVSDQLAPWMNDIRPTAMAAGDTAAGGTAARCFVRTHADHLRRETVRHGGTLFRARSLRLLMTIRIFPDLPRGETGLREAYTRERNGLVQTSRAVESFLLSLGVGSRRIDADELTSLLHGMLNPARASREPARAWRENLPIRDQVVRSAARADFETGLVTLDCGSAASVHHRVLSMAELPEATTAGMLTRLLPDDASVLELLQDGMLILNIQPLDDDEGRKRLEKRNNFAWQQLQNPRKKLDLVRIREDAEGALDEVLRGRTLLSMRLHAVLSGTSPEEVTERTRTVAATFGRRGIEMVAEDALALMVLLQSLPMAYDPASDRGMKRARTIVSTNVSDLLPAYGAFRGTGTGGTPVGSGVLLQNRLGEPVRFSFFDSDVAPHGIVTGVSGSGKSFMTNHLITSAMAEGGQVFLIDRGNSYRKLCKAFGGRYVTFDPDHPFRINPCGNAEGFTRDQHLALADLLAEMTSEGPTADLTKAERGLLMHAISSAYEGAHGEVFLGNLRSTLENEAKASGGNGVGMGRRARELALALEPYTRTGPYAGFLDGANEVTFDRQLIVFEMGEIALRRDIASVLLMALLKRIADFSAAPGNLERPKYLILDEAWTMLGSPATARFLENALRTYRKLGTAAVMVTQQVSDFAMGAAGAAILANAPNRLFLMQTAETLVALEKMLDLAQEEKEAIGSVQTIKGAWSEAYVKTPSAKGVVRLVPPPSFYWLATSDPADNAKLDRLAAEFRQAGHENPFLAAIDHASSDSGEGA